jgi:hypothetical protein
MENFGETEVTDSFVPEQMNLKKTRKRGPSGHVAAGRKWETSEKGRIWKAQTVKAKEELHAILKKRTGLDVYANQRMTLKYAGLMRDGKTAEAKRIVEKVVANAKEVAKKDSKKKTRRAQSRGPKENPARVAENTARNQIQPIRSNQPKIQPIQPNQPVLQNPAEFPANQFQQYPNVDRVELPDFLD